MNKRQQEHYQARQYKNLSQKNRGMRFETLIEGMCQNYQAKNIALIQKIPTHVGAENVNGKLANAHFKKKSTVDFTGMLCGGLSVAFEAKECASNTSFPLKNIKQHQLDYLRMHDLLGGCSFILIHFTNLNQIFRVEYKELEKMIQECAENKRKSIPIGRFAKISNGCNIVKMRHGYPDFMEAMN
ncbi:Holliday junction resolvase RecU [Listeria booriae]|uniref:Holliday junction resolvase RecU n=1 Tax=Listeria booriae TaxID=1552123 RepID=UPI0016260D10|nr:Holliday junction resolvase RecU [Listeria booriae]MBC2303389.1 Holliday junction resolvase RecU [Listeria booriae]